MNAAVQQARSPPPTTWVTEQLPRWRWFPLLLGTLMSLCVYYLDYSGDFHEGAIEASSPLAMPMRLASVLLIAGSLAPYRIKLSPPVLLIALYVASGFSYGISAGAFGEPNDKLFFNTILQLPILWAFSQTQWQIDYARWLRFVGNCLILQSGVDIFVLFYGETLWISKAFVGGYGNPSSFGLSCVVLCAFFLFHPGAGRYRVLKALALFAAALMSKSLFAGLGAAVVAAIWTVQDRRRLLAGVVVITGVVAVASWWFSTLEHELFLVHKLNAAGAFIGLVDYDADSSATVSVRSQMHATTFSAIADDQKSFLTGHLGGKVYWPMDSQVLTYLGSFGILMLFLFFMLHAYWISSAFKKRNLDGRFTLIALVLFGFIFFTNRILDYFPVASLYFVCIAAATARVVNPVENPHSGHAQSISR